MILYLETSNLVKIYVLEQGTEKILNQVHEAETVATSIVTYAESRAAFARKWREKDLGDKDHTKIKTDLRRDWNRYYIIDIFDETVNLAGDLAETHGLRGFDAIHLASAVILARAVDAPITFSSADLKLCQAAAKENLSPA